MSLLHGLVGACWATFLVLYLIIYALKDLPDESEALACVILVLFFATFAGGVALTAASWGTW